MVERDALEYAVELAAPQFHKDTYGNEWSSKGMYPVHPELPQELEVTTLTGLCDLVTNDIEEFDKEMVLVHVASHILVNLVTKKSDSWGRRMRYVAAQVPQTRGFSFGQFMDHETFLIGLLANFTDTPDRAYLSGIASHVEAGRVRGSLDDGVSQEITVKQGTSLKTSAAIKNRLTLAPYRTFREIEQPASEFLFRVRGGNETTAPTLALFEADGGKWQIDAMEAIGRYLRTQLDKDIPVVI